MPICDGDNNSLYQVDLIIEIYLENKRQKVFTSIARYSNNKPKHLCKSILNQVLSDTSMPI